VTGKANRSFAVSSLIGLVGAALLLLSSGCGEQDLYQPPDSPYTQRAQLTLPSQALGVDILDNYAYVANAQGGLQVVDISDPSNPFVAGWVDTPKRASGITVGRLFDDEGEVHDIAYLIEGTEGIVSYDISDPINPVNLQLSVQTYDAQTAVIVPPVTMGERYMIYLADSWRAVTVFATFPENPAQLDQRHRETPLGYTKQCAPSEDNTHLYVVEDEMGLSVYDIRSAYEKIMPRIGNVDTPGYAYGIDVDGDYAYVADKHGGLIIYEIGADYLPTQISSMELTGDPEKIIVKNGTAFLCADDAGLHIVDVSDPFNPIYQGNVPTTEAADLAVGDNGVVCIADRDNGLIVFTHKNGLGGDTTAPAVVTDLSTRLNDAGSVTLSWTAPGDDENVGTASLYEFYMAETAFEAETVGTVTEITARPFPLTAGTTQSFEVDGLTSGTTYYFGFFASDESGNKSPLSVLSSALMTTPTLSAGSVSPDSADVGTTFTFSVIYTDAENDAPVVSTVIVDGVEYNMSTLTDEANPDYTSGVPFIADVVIDWGSHFYQFAFDDGHGPLVKSELYSGPKTPANPFQFEMIAIDVGSGVSFTMGSPSSELGRDVDELEHTVAITGGFSLAEIEVTQALFNEVMDFNPAAISGDNRPVEQVTWFDACAFCNAYSDRESYTPAYTITNITTNEVGNITSAVVTWDQDANGYRLPTEAEWEYACRGGATTSLSGGELTNEYCDIDAILDPLGWYCANSDRGFGPTTQDSGTKSATAYGLYDMHGNVWEWCWDLYDLYPETAVIDPIGPTGDQWEQRVRRGGSWYYYARDCRSAARDAYWPASSDNTLGFRIARNAE
jgi:formylglycine-generating enzyme required for sulfatase activity